MPYWRAPSQRGGAELLGGDFGVGKAERLLSKKDRKLSPHALWEFHEPRGEDGQQDGEQQRRRTEGFTGRTHPGLRTQVSELYSGGYSPNWSPETPPGPLRVIRDL